MSATCVEAAPAKPHSVRRPSFSPRWDLLESARWVAIYAIVWLHTVHSEVLQPTTVLTRFAVPLFVAACVFLVFHGVQRKPERTFAHYASNRFLKIYVPFLGWSLIYLGFKALKSASLPDQANDYPAGLELLWTGGFYHLWFMPFIFLVSLTAFLVAKLVSRVEWLRGPVALGSLVAGIVCCLPEVGSVLAADHASWKYAVNALPAMFWGMTVGLAYGRGPRAAWESIARLRLELLLFLGCMVWLWIFGLTTWAENLAGVSLLFAVLRPVDSALLRRLAQFPSLTYGIYLSHLLPIKVCEAIATRKGLSPSWQLDCAVFLASSVAATLIALALYRARWTRWLVA